MGNYRGAVLIASRSNNKYSVKYIFILQVVSNKCILSVFWPSDVTSSIVGVFLVTIEFFVPLIILMYCYG